MKIDPSLLEGARTHLGCVPRLFLLTSRCNLVRAGRGAGFWDVDGKEYLDAYKQRAFCSGIVIPKLFEALSKTSPRDD